MTRSSHQSFKLIRTVPGAGDQHQHPTEERGGRIVQIATPLGSDAYPPHVRRVYLYSIHLSLKFLSFLPPHRARLYLVV
jgi:hypothetical protein